MSLSQEEVEKIAHLARLLINPSDIQGYTRNLSNILHLVEQMSAVDTSNVKPMAHPMDTRQRLRVDDVTEPDQHELFQKNAPEVLADLYLVPTVIEE